MSNGLPPNNIILHQQSKSLELVYADHSYTLPAEYLRVSSPSAEVQGHGPGQEILQINKENVGITQLEPIGHYAIKIYFDDGHDSGLFTWDYLRILSTEQVHRWQYYLDRLAKAGYDRKQ
jgi:DUF971 family protein|tara:strand:- start:2290 stop:2649 length:360 start_codon:yes stop_codon:yes gene_type:complete